MKVAIVDDGVQVTLVGREARILVEELSDVPGGSKLLKVRQLHDELQEALVWIARGAGGYSKETVDVKPPSYTPPRRGRPPKQPQPVPTVVEENDPFLAFVRSRLEKSPP